MTDLYKPLTQARNEYLHWASSDLPRIPLGYSIIDKPTGGGIAPGETCWFVSRPSVGKTAFALNVVANNPDVPTLMFSVEMHARYILARLAAIVTRTPTYLIERQIAQHGQSWALDEVVAEYHRFGICDLPTLTQEQMNQSLELAEDDIGSKVRLVIVDYLELLAGVGNAVEQVDHLAVSLKAWARQHDVAVLVLHQVSRDQGGNGDRPLGLRSGRYGGEQAADYFMAGYRPCLNPILSIDEYKASQGDWYLQLLKNRAGGDIHPQGKLHYYDPDVMLLAEQPLGQAILLPEPVL